jgi:mono/diheme cytochrome c family protein
MAGKRDRQLCKGWLNMKITHLRAAAVAALGLSLQVQAAPAGDQIDIGKKEFEASCALCHGLGGKGDGPYEPVLQGPNLPDLTTISKRNGGVFPKERIYETIDGRASVATHGTPREMPVWGNRFEPARIEALVAYLDRLQAK